MKRILFVPLLLLASTGMFAQQEPPAAPKKVAVRAARMIDVVTGAVVPRAVVLIEGERITAAGSGLAIPASTPVIDLGNWTLLPGLIDAHTHLLMRGGMDYAQMLLTKSQAFRALEGAANSRLMIRAGFTTVRDMETEGAGYDDVALRDAIAQGLIEGPRIVAATLAIAAVGAYAPYGVSPDIHDFPTGAQLVSGVDEARRAVREQIAHGADVIKVYADGTEPGRPAYPSLSVDELKAIVEVAHRAGRRVAVHATTAEGARNAVAAGVDSIEHGSNADRETLQTMKAKGIFLVPTISTTFTQLQKQLTPEQRKNNEARVQTIKTAFGLGLRIANGSDLSDGTNAREIVTLQKLGMTPLDAIRAATIGAAQLLDWQDRVGAIKPNAFADIIAVAGDPLADLTELERVVFVMKGGAVVKQVQANAETGGPESRNRE